MSAPAERDGAGRRGSPEDAAAAYEGPQDVQAAAREGADEPVEAAEDAHVAASMGDELSAQDGAEAGHANGPDTQCHTQHPWVFRSRE